MRLLTMSSPTSAMPLRVPGDLAANLLCNVQVCLEERPALSRLILLLCSAQRPSFLFETNLYLWLVFVWVVKRYHLEQCHHGQQISTLFVIVLVLYKTYLLI